MDHPYIENDIEAFCHDPEGHYFDRKSARKDADEIAKHLMAFANAAGGKLVVGIEDDGTVTGFKRDKAHSIEGFEQAYVTELAPSPRVKTERMPVVNEKGDDDHVLIMDVRQAPRDKWCRSCAKTARWRSGRATRACGSTMKRAATWCPRIRQRRVLLRERSAP